MTVRAKHGLSAIEILVGTSILVVLILAGTPSLKRALGSANDVATQAYVQHVIKGIEIERKSGAASLPDRQSCANLTHVREDPTSVVSCTYAPNFHDDTYTVTATSVTGVTFHYDGSEVLRLR